MLISISSVSGSHYQWEAEWSVAPGFIDGPQDLPADKTTLDQAAAKAGGASLTDITDTWPPEDIAGPPGYEMFVAAMADPKHPEHADLKAWYGGTFETNTPASDDLPSKF